MFILGTVSSPDVICYGASSLNDAVSSNWPGKSLVTNLNEESGKVSFECKGLTSMTYMFFRCKNITRLDVSNLDTSEVTTMFRSFSSLRNIYELDLSNFDTSKVTNMSYMFAANYKIKSINLSNFDTSKVTNMSYMFHGNDYLESINLSNFDTSKVTNMSRMFGLCGDSSAKGCTINCPNGLDMSNVSNCESMFTLAKFAKPIHLKNVPSGIIESGTSSSDWVLGGDNKGTRGVHYIIDSVIS